MSHHPLHLNVAFSRQPKGRIIAFSSTPNSTLPFTFPPKQATTSVTAKPSRMSESLRRRAVGSTTTGAGKSSFIPTTKDFSHTIIPTTTTGNKNERAIRVISKAALEDTNGQSKSRLLSGLRGTIIIIVTFLLISTLFLSIAEGWTLLDSLYFAVVVATTVGYGDISPLRSISKIFVSVYAIVSVTIIVNLLQSLVENVSSKQNNVMKSTTATLIENNHNKDDLINILHMKKLRATLKLRSSIVMFIGTCTSGILLYKYFLNETLIDVIYFLCVTITTVGLGDVHPKTSIGKAFAIIWLIFTSLGFANIISQFADLKVKEKEYEIAQNILSDNISNNMFNEIDGNNDNTLSEAEYLGYIICKLGKSSPDDIRSILLKFRQLDKDSSGFITRKDLNI